MTLKVYLIHHQNHIAKQYDQQLEEIKQLNPDKILLFCLEEAEPQVIFREFFPKLSPWLVENNKIAKVLLCNPDNKELSPNIFTEKTLGFYFYSKWTVENFDRMGIDFTKSHTHATKLYTCYNANPKFHRAVTVDLLARENLLDLGIVSVQYPDFIQNDYDGTPYQYKYYDKRDLKDEPNFDKSTGQYDVLSMPNSFLKGFIDLVTESQYDPYSYFVTEKTIKSIAALKPFLAVSSVNYHKFIQEEYGFEPYTEIFDYSFDSKENVFDRVEGIIENIKRMIPVFNNIEERNRIHDILLPKMIHNKEQFFKYANKQEKMISPSLKFVTETKDYELFGDVSYCQHLFDFYKGMGWTIK